MYMHQMSPSKMVSSGKISKLVVKLKKWSKATDNHK